MALTESDPPRKLLEASQKLHEENKRLQLEIARLKEDKIDILGEIEDEKKTLFKHCDDKENEIKSAKKEIDDLKRYIDEAHANYLKKDKELSDLSILYNSMKSEKENMEKTLLTSTAVSATSSDIFVANSVLPSSTAISTYTMANVKNINNENKTAVTMTSSAASVPLSSITGLGAVASSAVPSSSGRLINEAIATQNSALIGNSTYGVKLPTYKSPGDIETFISRFEQYCITQNVEDIRKANLLLTAIDDATFTVVKRELTDDERKNYNTIKKHLEKRFDLLKDAGQKRLIFRQARREHGQTIEEFYTQLLGMAAKAFPGESSQAVDRMILDQLICGCADEKIRFHLIEKAPATSRDALSLAVAYQAAIKYNESLKDNILISTIQGENNQDNYSNETRGRNIIYSQSTRDDENFRGRDSDYHDQYNRNYSAERGRDRRNEYFNRGQHEDRIIKGRNFSPRNIFSESGQERRLRSQERINYAINNGNIFRGNINGNLRPEYGGNFRNDRIQENYRNQPRTNRTISTERQNATQRLVRFNGDRAGYTNILSSPTHLFYVNGMFGNEILAILIDSGSAATIIDEEIWKNIKGERDVLEKVPFSIRSATKHELEILGQKTISFSLLYRNHKGSKEFRTNVIVVKGLTHKAVLGLDFLIQYGANMDMWNKKLILFSKGVKSAHQLIEKNMKTESRQIANITISYIQNKTNLSKSEYPSKLKRNITRMHKIIETENEHKEWHYSEPIIHTPTIKNSRTSSHEPSPIEFVTPQMNNREIKNSRKIEKEIVESTPINEEILNSPGGQNEIDKQTNYEKEIRQLLDFSETGETSFKTIKDQMETTANLSDCNEESDDEQDADIESLYEPNREITPPLPRRNPERQRKKPERYGIYEINNITETQPNIYKGRGNYHGFGHWQLSLLMMCCLFIPFGNVSAEQTTMKERIRSEPIMQSLWQKVMIAVCTFFSSETGYLLGVILGYAIGISILAGVIIYLMHLNRNNARISQLLIFIAIITLGKTEIITTNNNLGVLFGPAHICGGSGHHSLYMELPDEIECIWTDPREPLLENVVVTTYFPKTFSNKISAYGCTVEIKSITTSMGFWGTKSILDKSLVYRKLDYEDCLKEVRHLKNKERNLVEIGHETWTNDSAPFEAKFTWLTTYKQERYRIILKEIEIKFNFNTGKVVSPDFQLHNCVMNSSYCEQSEVTILWQTTEKSYCNLQEGKTVIAQRMRDNQRRGWMMTSDAGQFTLTGPLSTKLMCGIPDIYTSDQGVFVKVRNVTFSQTLAEKIRSQIGKAEGPTTTYTGLINYVAHQLQNMMVELFKKNYLNICRLNQERIIYLHHLASQPSTAYLASRMLMKSQNVMGYSSGQLITTYQCDIVEEYYQQPTDQCYNTIPITYKNQEKNFTRYLLPASMDLLPLDSPIPCNKPTAVFIKSIKQHEAEERQSRLIYRWNGSILSTEPNLQYRHATMLEQLGNITDLHLMSSTIYDASHEEVDTLMELTMASNLLVSMANSLHLGSTGLDSHMLLHGANATLTVMKATINRVIDTTYPFIKWIGKLIKFSIITLLVITIIIISVKLWKWLKTKQRKQETRQTRNDIVRFLTSLQQNQKDNQRTTEENNSNVRD